MEDTTGGIDGIVGIDGTISDMVIMAIIHGTIYIVDQVVDTIVHTEDIMDIMDIVIIIITTGLVTITTTMGILLIILKQAIMDLERMDH